MLHLFRIQATQVYHDPLRAGVNDVQELSKSYEAIARAKTEIQHRILTHSLPLYFPEIDRFRGSRSDWFFAFLHAFPMPASITAVVAVIALRRRSGLSRFPSQCSVELMTEAILALADGDWSGDPQGAAQPSIAEFGKGVWPRYWPDCCVERSSPQNFRNWR
ncbi:hypothetical protein A9K71_21210 [Mesorhizobium sp. WSM3873]|nr:hypothetical protein A9K71_21210 [Mesorhizobium sp. WSM3873]